MAGEGIRFPHRFSGVVGEGEVKAGEVEGPACLVAVQLLGSAEVGEVLVICVNLKLLLCPLQEVLPFL